MFATATASTAVPALLPDERPRTPSPKVFELVLREPTQLSAVLSDELQLPRATQRLLALSLLGLGVHGAVLGASLSTVHLTELAWVQHGLPALWMPVAFALSFVGALGICLPSFYFYTQLSGLDASFRLVTAQALRTQATASQILLGFQPFYAAAVLAAGLGLWGDPDEVVVAGFGLPFLAGLWGIYALYNGFRDLAATLPVTHQRRGRFLQRMVLCWGGVFSVIAPVALYRLVEWFTRIG
jgi:hypothetical protein